MIKMLILCASVGLANLAMIARGDAFLIWQGATDDLWKRKCHYYYPVRLYSTELPLSHTCPMWATAS